MRRLGLLHPEHQVGSLRTAILLALLTWFPLLILCLAQGLFVGGARIPFLDDIAAHTRFLLAVPILVLADIPVGFRLREMVVHFYNSRLLREAERPQFRKILLDILRQRDSRLVELVVFAAAYITSFLNIDRLSIQTGSTWYTPAGNSHLSLSGYWYALVALPLFQFLLYRWMYRMYLWASFLGRVAKLNLQLSPAHPDGAGGLGFLGKSLIPFGVITFGVSTVISGSIASRIIFAGARLDSFAVVYIALLFLSVAVFAGPLLVFTPRLVRLKYRGILAYGDLADRYTNLFDKRWIANESDEVDGHPLLGSEDLKALAALGDSFELVRKMRAVPLERIDFILLAIPAILPAIPLLGTQMPLTEIIKDLLHLVA